MPAKLCGLGSACAFLDLFAALRQAISAAETPNIIPREALTVVTCFIYTHRSCHLRSCRPGRTDVAVLPGNRVRAQAGATAILSVNRPQRFGMKRPAPSDGRTIPEGSHWVVLCVDETEHTGIRATRLPFARCASDAGPVQRRPSQRPLSLVILIQRDRRLVCQLVKSEVASCRGSALASADDGQPDPEG